MTATIYRLQMIYTIIHPLLNLRTWPHLINDDGLEYTATLVTIVQCNTQHLLRNVLGSL